MSLRKSIAFNTVYCVGAINTSKIDHSSKDNDAMMCLRHCHMICFVTLADNWSF